MKTLSQITKECVGLSIQCHQLVNLSKLNIVQGRSEISSDQVCRSHRYTHVQFRIVGRITSSEGKVVFEFCG